MVIRPADLMVHDVAMQHPVAGIVGDEGDVHRFLRRNEDGVGPLSIGDRGTVALEHPEAVAVQVHRMHQAVSLRSSSMQLRPRSS